MIRTSLRSLIATFGEFGSRTRSGRKVSNKQPASAPQVTIVGLMNAEDDDGRTLVDVGGRSGWQVTFVATCDDANAALGQGGVPVAFCDRDLLGVGWRKAVERLSAAPHRACVILLSEAVDTNLWNEVVRGGGYDVLPKPLDEENLMRVVRLARSYWNSPARTGLLFNRSPQLAKEGRS